jgi:ABC-type methionine transport system ATPase subunit
MIKKRVTFTIPQEMLMQPILYTMNKQYNVKTSIYMSEMSDKEGVLKLEMEGEEKQIDEAITWAMAKGIHVRQVK